MGTRVSRPVWIVVATLVIALGVGAVSTAAFAGLNPAFKIAVHVKAHPTSCTKGYPTFTTPANIITTFAGTGDIDLMPVFYGLVGFKLNETGLIWPEAAWGSASWIKCKGDVGVGTIMHSADNAAEDPQTRGMAIAWANCQTTWASAPGYAYVIATGPGRVVPAPHPAVNDFGVTDCSADAAYDYPIAIYGSGVGGTAGDAPAADPVCSVDPLSLDFGTVLLGGWQQRTFTVTNTGDAMMTGRVKVACADTTTFKIVSGGGIYYLTHNQFVNVTVEFRPTTVGAKTCTIETGAGICGDVSCTGAGDIPPACQVNPTSLNFFTVAVGDSSDKTFTIKNNGGGTLSGSVSETCDHYSIASGGGAYNLTASQQVTVTVRFQPTSAGLKTCNINTGATCAQVACQGTGEQLIVPLTISKDDAIASTACAFPGGGVTYTVSYNNPNTSSVTNVVVTDYLAADVDFVSATGGGTYSSTGHKVVWNLGTLTASTGGSVGVATTVKLAASPAVALLDSCDIVSTETPTPAKASHTTAVCACAISGPTLVCPQSTHTFCGPDGMTSYAWSVTGVGTIVGPSNAQCVDVMAASSCAAAYTVILDLVQPVGVHSQCEKLVVVDDLVAPEITFCPQGIAVQCVGDVPAANPAVVTATDNCGTPSVTHVGDA